MRPLAYCCALLLLAASAFGAEPDASAEEPESTETSEDDSATPADIDAAVNEEIREAEEAAAEAPANANDEAFVPSVQISEDLSVSFPVDI